MTFSCVQKRGGAAVYPAAGIDGAEAYAAVVELSGERYAGRIIGGAGGAAARDYLSRRLEGAGLTISAFEFQERAALNDGEAFLELEDGSVAATGAAGSAAGFRYRENFREVVRGGYDGGRAEGPLVALEARDSPFPRGAIPLVAAAMYDSSGLDAWAAAGAAGLLVELPTGSVEQRPLWAGQPPGRLVTVRKGMPVLALSGEAYLRLKAAAEVRSTPVARYPAVRMASPVRFSDVTGVNLMAAWNGDGGGFSPRLILMAHYDHVGADPDGSRFPGALDNASGVGLALALAEALAEGGAPVDFAALFTDGEEAGLSGARAFASAPPFPLAGVDVINIDMVGSASDTEYSVYSSGGQAGITLALRLERALRAAGFRVAARHPEENLDHGPLARAGATAVSVCEYDTERYHRKSDTAEHVDPAEMDAAGDALYGFIVDLVTNR
jgi:hypothetical protein